MLTFQRHAAPGTLAGRVLLNFRMHGTAVDELGRYRLRLGLVQIEGRAGDELVAATGAAKIIALSLKGRARCGRFFFNLHAAYRIGDHGFSVLPLLHYNGTSITEDYAAMPAFRRSLSCGPLALDVQSRGRF